MTLSSVSPADTDPQDSDAWEDFTRGASERDLQRYAELPRSARAWYVKAVEELGDVDELRGDVLMRQQFKAWADRLASVATHAFETGDRRDKLRKHVGDPDLYPGGRGELLRDAVHDEALRLAWRLLGMEIQEQQQRLNDLNDADQALRYREVGCYLCGRRRGQTLQHPRNTMLTLDDHRGLCDDCLEIAEREREWSPIAEPLSEW